MKKLFIPIALATISLLSADQYYQPYGNGYGSCPNCTNGGRNYSGQYDQGQTGNGWRNQSQYDQNGNGWRNNQGQYDQGRNDNGSRNNYQYNDGWRNNSDQMSNNGWRNNQGMVNDNNYRNSRGDQTPNSDQEIYQKIQEKLNSGWFSKGFESVSFGVRNGDVLLRGSVETIEDKNKVEDNVRKVDGVRRINNQIRIDKESANDYKDTQLQDSEKKYPHDQASNQQDRQINAKIRDKLGNGWFSKGYDNIEIKTTNGTVMLSGTVDNTDEIQKINNQIKEIEGVRKVDIQLSVKNQ